MNISPVLAKLLVERGVHTYEDARHFFRPDLADLHDPFLMADMDKAVERLTVAMRRNEKILVYGDYDVDGTTSVSMVYKFLKQFVGNVDFYIPDRYTEGYGISIRGIDYAAAHHFTLVVALDCGIKAVEKVKYAKELGVDFIICDHHTPDAVLPPAVAVLDPKREDCPYPYKHLSGCGVGFKLLQALAQVNNVPFAELMPLLDLVTLSIASDIVPITGENRVLALRAEAAELRTQRGGEGHHRRVRAGRQGNHDKRHRVQDRPAHQCLGAYEAGFGGGATARVARRALRPADERDP